MSKKVLLIADDVEMSRAVIRRFLGKDYITLEAANGVAVMEIMKAYAVDALLLDIIMPEMDGLEVLHQLRGDDRWKHVGILVATSTKEHTERQALLDGADDVVAKPYDPTVIRKRLENVLAKKALEAQSETNAADVIRRELRDALCAGIEAQIDEMDRLADILKDNLDNTVLSKACVLKLQAQLELLRQAAQKEEQP